MEEKRVIIIGAGIARLSTGCYLQMNNYKTQIFEMHNIAGGVCTSWKRKSYTFDGCVHWLVGSGPSHSLHNLWLELNALENVEIINNEVFKVIEYEKGKFFTIHRDINKFAAELKRVAPEDSEVIDDFVDSVKRYEKLFKIPIGAMQKSSLMHELIRDGYIDFSDLRFIAKWTNKPCKDFVNSFKSQLIRRIWCTLVGPESELTAIGLIAIIFAPLNIKSAGYPVGGSLKFVQNIEKRYLNLNGKINYSSKVEKILVKDGKAYGVKLVSGEIHLADILVSAADGHDSIFNMLEGKYLDDEISQNYRSLPLFTPFVQVSLGIAKEIREYPFSTTFMLDKPLKTCDKIHIPSVTFKIYNIDPTMAPQGKTSITASVVSDYEYWDNLKKHDAKGYESEKERIANEIIELLDQKIGDVKSNLEVVDVATPVTHYRYTNNWKGSWEGWFPTVKTIRSKMKKTLPGLENFYLAGQWVEPGGGLPTGALSGRNVAQIICEKDEKNFISQI